MKDAKTINPILSLANEYNTSFKEGSSERQISKILLQNICKVAEWSVEETALCCHVSVSTLRRFLKDMGYASFTEFRQKIVDTLTNHDYLSPAAFEATQEGLNGFIQSTAGSFINDIHCLLNQFNPESFLSAARLLYHSKFIFIHAFINSHMCLSLQSNLAMTGKNVTRSEAPTQQYADASAADPGCTYIVLYDGQPRSRNVIHTILTIHRRGGKIILITEDNSFMHKDLCEIVISLGTGSFALSSMTLFEFSLMYLSETYKTMYLSGKQLILRKTADTEN